MPGAGKTALADYSNAGGGLVFTEWAAYHVSKGQWQTLAPKVLLSRTSAYSGQVTYTVDTTLASHPLWAGGYMHVQPDSGVLLARHGMHRRGSLYDGLLHRAGRHLPPGSGARVLSYGR